MAVIQEADAQAAEEEAPSAEKVREMSTPASGVSEFEKTEFEKMNDEEKAASIAAARVDFSKVRNSSQGAFRQVQTWCNR